MKLSDIDFSAISRMMDAMSDEEKEKLNDMAEDMMSNFKQEVDEPEEELDLFTRLGVLEETYRDLPGIVLDQLEAGLDLEDYYVDIVDADRSGSVLFYAKAVLNMCRTYHFSIYRDVLGLKEFTNPDVTTLSNYLYPLMDVENIHKLVKIHSSEYWIEHRDFLQSVFILLNRAEYDRVSKEELEGLKDRMFKENRLIKIAE